MICRAHRSLVVHAARRHHYQRASTERIPHGNRTQPGFRPGPGNHGEQGDAQRPHDRHRAGSSRSPCGPTGCASKSAPAICSTCSTKLAFGPRSLYRAGSPSAGRTWCGGSCAGSRDRQPGLRARATRLFDPGVIQTGPAPLPASRGRPRWQAGHPFSRFRTAPSGLRGCWRWMC